MVSDDEDVKVPERCLFSLSANSSIFFRSQTGQGHSELELQLVEMTLEPLELVDVLWSELLDCVKSIG